MNVRVPIIIDVMIDGSRNALAVALACACAGIVIGIVALTGAGIVFTQAVIGLSQNYLLLALILTGVAGIVLGMGMPTTPAYIVMTSLLVPALIKLGVMMPAAQMFAFYFAILSAITPPVALAVYAAARLAKADLWTSGWAAVKIGATGFIVPFMFVYEPALLMIGDWPTIIWRFVCSCLGIGLVAAGLHGYLLRRCASWERVLLVGAAFCLVKPDWLTDLLGLGLAAAMFAFQWPQRDRPLPTRSVGPVTAGGRAAGRGEVGLRSRSGSAPRPETSFGSLDQVPRSRNAAESEYPSRSADPSDAEPDTTALHRPLRCSGHLDASGRPPALGRL
ncbi:DUF3394 domain-containing protein [Bosea sp. Root670]|uniref:DUF3394 domain-containing protein n=1 Tax=Bosea sp. Root670 TaxID=1736583 RepID=UPI000A4F9C79|nr:DUF3394 domain-containing protein [Bosea sp. Root670]